MAPWQSTVVLAFLHGLKRIKRMGWDRVPCVACSSLKGDCWTSWWILKLSCPGEKWRSITPKDTKAMTAITARCTFRLEKRMERMAEEGFTVRKLGWSGPDVCSSMLQSSSLKENYSWEFASWWILRSYIWKCEKCRSMAPRGICGLATRFSSEK